MQNIIGDALQFLNSRTLRKFYLAFVFPVPTLLFSNPAHDSTAVRLQPVEVKVNFLQQPLMRTTSSLQVLNENKLQQQSAATFTGALNSAPGVRMEERSPGSYRLALRGSMIRSPFGIRNTKIYIDEFPLTDAGGNTYLNLLDPYGIAAITINKGPDGSLYGANSGGVLRIDPKGFGDLENKINLQLTAGAFGLFQEQLSVQRRINEKYQFSFDQSFLRSDGYRDQSGLNKKTFQTAHQWQYSPKNQARLFVLYSDLAYQTPGGLTAAQYAENPKGARPAVGAVPGAQEQKAAIYNKTWIAGLTHQSDFAPNFTHTISAFAALTDFENPFITNYEYRNEQNVGLRTYFSWNKPTQSEVSLQMQIGAESYWGSNDKKNYSNNGGVHGDMLDEDNLNNYQLNIFYRAMMQVWDRWTIEGSLGYNKNTVRYEEIYPLIDEPQGEIDFDGIWMPRLASSFLLNSDFALRASIAKGYSTPTIEEIRPSDRIINVGLRPEIGTNTEAGLRYTHPSQRLLVDLAAYRYVMDDGIVRQINDVGEDYYVNAGNMLQKGVEFGVWANLIDPREEGFVQQISLHSGTAYQHYRFGDYKVADKDFSGNKITAVPQWTLSNSVQLRFARNVYWNILHQFVDEVPLDDANTVYADKYHLLQMKVGIALPAYRSTTWHLFVGGDNLLNESYSLGNDINAFGGRYFNPAPSRHFYAGLRVEI